MKRNNLKIFKIVLLLSFLLFCTGCNSNNAIGNKSPVANAGKDIVVIQNKLFTFDGSKSYDLDGNITNYEWLCADFNISLYKGLESSLTIPAQRPIGVYGVKLIVTDDKNATAEDIVLVKIIKPTLVANAGEDIIVKQHELFTFDGSKSYDLDGNITNYEWYCTDYNITLYKGTESNLTIPAERPVGEYKVKLIVTDDKNKTAEDIVKVIITKPDDESEHQNGDIFDIGITVDQFKTLKQQGAVYIDIRTPNEWNSQTGIIEDSYKIANQSNIQNDSEFLNIVTQKDQSFILICAAGGRAYTTANKLKNIGYTNVHYLEGGIDAWIAAGEPTVQNN
jgi:rhodanese-related sulfurtransferase